MPIYNEIDIIKSFSDLNAHKNTSSTIIAHSTNKTDIRETALKGIDFSKVKNILDLGCGFGFFTSGLKGKIKKGTHIVGLDIQDIYQKPFLGACKNIGAIGEFHASDAIELATYPQHTFDLVLSSFSLYFFPDILKHIARILTKNGTFVAITHSRSSLSELIKHLPVAIKGAGLKVPEILSIQKLFSTFSMENGAKMLKPYFKDVQMRKYENLLVFRKGDIHKIKSYLKMKQNLLFKEITESAPDSVGDALNQLIVLLTDEVRKKKTLSFNKNDAVFFCRKPVAQLKKIHRPAQNKFCPSCGSGLKDKLIEDKKRGVCENCGYIAYENPLPVVSAVVLNSKKEVLLVKRARQPMKGMWCLPAGFAEADEHIEDAVLRELKEETGIKGKIKRLIDADTSHNFFYGNLLMITFEVAHAGGKIKAGSDADDVKFFPTAKLPPLAFPTNERAIRKIFKN